MPEMSVPSPLLFQLLDDTPAVVRSIVPEDAAKLEKGLHNLSTESRVRRFFYDMSQYTGKELRDLTHCDVQTRLALVLGILDENGNEVETVAIARCFQNAEKPWEGEATIVTMDAWQRLGIGTILIRELARRSRDLGIRTWRICQFSDNCAVRKIMTRVGHQTLERDIGAGVLEAEYTLGAPDETIEGEAFRDQ
jgi:GNAT superfamily N-acetyltransferase